MKWMVVMVIMGALLVLAPGTTGPVRGAGPVGGCPDDFHLHNVADMDNHEGDSHRHVGTAADQNGDGFICVKHLPSVHVHVDNTARPY